jgi:thioesterase domain-containing protein/acyl carrier protein
MSQDSSGRAKGLRDSSEIQTWMISQLAEVLGLRPDQIDPRRDLTSYGLDSLRAFELTGDLAYWLDYDVPVTLFWDYPTIETLSIYLSEQVSNGNADARTNDQAAGPLEAVKNLSDAEIPNRPTDEHSLLSKTTGKSSVLFALRTAETLAPVFAVPGLYGHIIVYADLSRELGPEQPFYGLQAVGLDGAEAPLESIEEMAKLYLSEIRKVQPRGPYVLIGACFGATVAYEMARQLLIGGREVAFLGLLDPTHREGFDAGENSPSTSPVMSRTKAVSSFFTGRLRLYIDEMRSLNTGGRIKFLTHKIRSFRFKMRNRKAFRGVQLEIYQLEVIQANIRALDRYQRKPLNGRLRAVEVFESSNLRNTKEDSFDWKALWNGHVTLHSVPGKDSGDMLNGKNARIIAQLLRDRLHAALKRESSL